MSQDAAGHYQASRAHVQRYPAGQDQQEQAARLDEDNPLWLILWGIYSLQFVAFPLFDVPDGAVLFARSASELVRRMRQAEAVYGTAPHRGQGRHA